jgi:hypothetical protein
MPTPPWPRNACPAVSSQCAKACAEVSPRGSSSALAQRCDKGVQRVELP